MGVEIIKPERLSNYSVVAELTLEMESNAVKEGFLELLVTGKSELLPSLLSKIKFVPVISLYSEPSEDPDATQSPYLTLLDKRKSMWRENSPLAKYLFPKPILTLTYAEIDVNKLLYKISVFLRNRKIKTYYGLPFSLGDVDGTTKLLIHNDFANEAGVDELINVLWEIDNPTLTLEANV